MQYIYPEDELSDRKKKIASTKIIMLLGKLPERNLKIQNAQT